MMLTIETVLSRPYIESFRKNDERTWCEIYDTLHPYYMARLRTRWNHLMYSHKIGALIYSRNDWQQVQRDIDTIFHDALLKFHSLLVNGRFVWQSVEGTERYIYKVIMNEMRRTLRQKRKTIALLLEDYHHDAALRHLSSLSQVPAKSSTEYYFDVKEMSKQIRELIDNKCTAREAEVARRRLWHFQSYKRIARECNIAEGSARNIMLKVRKIIVSHLKDEANE